MADWRVTDPLVAAAVKAGGLLSNVMPQGMMTPARILDETVSGNQKSITEQDLTPEQLKFLKDLIANKEEYAKKTETPSGTINYEDYKRYAEQLPDGQRVFNKTPGLLSVLDPYGQMQTTLGQFRYTNGKDGINIRDVYDFNNLQSQAGAMETALGMYGAVRDYAGRQVPEGAGRPVNINLLSETPQSTKKKKSLLD